MRKRRYPVRRLLVETPEELFLAVERYIEAVPFSKTALVTLALREFLRCRCELSPAADRARENRAG